MTTDSHEESPTETYHMQVEETTLRPRQRNQKLIQARLNRGWTQGQLAERLGMLNSEAISRWENGWHEANLFYKCKLRDVFGLTFEELGYPVEPVPNNKEMPPPLPVEQIPIKEGAPPLPPMEQLPIPEEALPPRRKWSRVIIGVISGLIVVLLILGIVSRLVFPPPPPICGAFSDSFHGSKLASWWHWENPSGRAAYSLTTAGLSLSTSAHSDLDPRFHYEAPRLLQSITGNFTIETRLVFRPTTHFQSAGILLWQNEYTFMRFERSFEGKKSGLLIQKFDDGLTPMPISPLGQFPTTSGEVELRVQRQGDLITASWREEPGQSWQTAGETDLHFDSLMVGVDLLDDFNTLPTTTASYTYFKVSCT